MDELKREDIKYKFNIIKYKTIYVLFYFFY